MFNRETRGFVLNNSISIVKIDDFSRRLTTLTPVTLRTNHFTVRKSPATAGMQTDDFGHPWQPGAFGDHVIKRCKYTWTPTSMFTTRVVKLQVHIECLQVSPLVRLQSIPSLPGNERHSDVANNMIARDVAVGSFVRHHATLSSAGTGDVTVMSVILW